MGQHPHAIRRSDDGFTLTELLIVIVILGVLTGIVVFAVGSFANAGEASACKAAMKTTEVAVEAFRANNARLPNSMAELQPAYLRSDPSDPAQYDIFVSWGPAGTGVVTGDLTPKAPVTADCSA